MLKQGLLFLLLPLFLAGCLKTEDPPLSFEEQLELDKTIIETYLAENSIDAEYDDRGFWYVVHEEGNEEGKVPVSNSVITIKYTGMLLSNGNVFDTSVGATNDQRSFQLNTLITGWRMGIPLMKEGAFYTFYFPSGFCYGIAGSGSIPPNANLIFEIELRVVI